MNVLLISTYELGHQPFGLASPAAWLRREGLSVACLDLSREPLGETEVGAADFIAFYVPMHTATRLAVNALPAVRQLNPRARLCFYGLYAPVNTEYLRKLGVQTILGGEFEEALLRAVQDSSQSQPLISLDRLKFVTPDRTGLPSLARYARLQHPAGGPLLAGYTEASRGCKHLCRHCPIVPVYTGRFRIVQPEVVLEDIRQQVGAGAQHITFGDPDFFNGIRHALYIVTALHQEHPNVTYDATIKVEHLLQHAAHLRLLKQTGCLFITTAVESADDRVLALLEKGHTFADFVRVVALARDAGLALCPTFIAFTPWTTLESYCELLEAIARLELVENVAPVQLGLRLLIPAGSRLLELADIRRIIGRFSEENLVYPWVHPDRRLDNLYTRVQQEIQEGLREKVSRARLFARVYAGAREAAGLAQSWRAVEPPLTARAAIPYLNEPWYC